MGEIIEFECKSCKNKFNAKVGIGEVRRAPRLKPTQCPKCSSTNIKELGEVGYWD